MLALAGAARETKPRAACPGADKWLVVADDGPGVDEPVRDGQGRCEVTANGGLDSGHVRSHAE